MQKLIVAEDLTALGQISLTGALSVCQALNVRPASLPTTILSTQSEGFGRPVAQTTAPWLAASLSQWQDQGETFQGALIGYVGNAPLVHQLATWLATQPTPLRIVDPVLGDQGHRYPGMAAAVVMATRELCRHATVLTPNWTELCLLAGAPVTAQPDRAQLANRLAQLRAQGITGQVVVTGLGNATTVATAYQVGNELHWLTVPKRPGHFYGTGDLLAAILAGGLVRGWSFSRALQVAHEGVRRAVTATAPLSPAERRYGLVTGPTLAYLNQLVADADRGV